MTTDTVPSAEPSRVETLLADLAEKYHKPDPSNIALGAQRFEFVLNGRIVPFVGMNAFLAAGVALHQIYSNHLVPLFFCYLTAAFGVLVRIYWRRDQVSDTSAMHFSAVSTFLLAAILTIQIAPVAFVLCLLLSYGLTALVRQSKIPQTSVPIYVIYLPILLADLQKEQGFRLGVELLALIPMGFLFAGKRFRVATSAVIFSGLLTAGLESSEKTDFIFVLLLLLLVCLVVWYEIYIPKTDYSNLRAAIDHASFLLLSGLAILATHFSSFEPMIWTWAVLVAFYEMVQILREAAGDPTRVGAIGVALVIAVWATRTSIQEGVVIAASLVIAALMNIAAVLLANSFLSNLSFFVVVPGAIRIYLLSRQSFSAMVVALALLTTTGVLLMAHRPPSTPTIRWWQGFVKQKDWDWTKSMLAAAGGALLRIPFASFVFGVFRTAYLWLRYFKGTSEPFGLTDLFYAAAQFYGALILTYQLQLLTAARNYSANVQLASCAALWVLWGLAIFAAGIRRRAIYQRLISLAFMIAPGILYFPVLKDGGASLALVTIIVGGGFWIVGLLKDVRNPSEPEGGTQEGVAATIPT